MSYSNKLYRIIYFNSPFLIKNIISSLYGLKSTKERYGNYYEKWVSFLKKSQYYSEYDLISYRNEETLKFINYSLKANDFLKNFHGLNELKRIEDLKKLKIIDKSFIRENLKKLTTKCSGKTRYTHTSGTTGSSIIFPITLECFQREYAFRTLHYSWSGVDLRHKPKIATFAGHPVAHPKRYKTPFWVYDFANNWLLFSSYHLDSNSLKYYIPELENFDPILIHGYPSSIYLVAKAYKKYGKKPLKNLKSIYTASETLFNFQRREIEDAFQVKVYNWYGNSEMCANIVECEKGRMHLKYEHSYVEILNSQNEDCKPGEKGRLVCTGFGNRAFPLIRYDIKDEVIISEEKSCPCGRSGLLIKEVLGRIEDYIITPSGRRIGRLDHLFKDTLGIKEAQIYQDKIDEIELRIVFQDTKTKKENIKILKDECKVRFGDELKIKIIEVDQIPRGPNGKFKFVINKLNIFTD